MKNIILAAFATLFFFGNTSAQQILYQDTTFTDPVLVSFLPDFVTIKNCRFVGISGTALTIEGSGVLVSGCTFEDIDGTAVYALAGEVYLLEDTIRNVSGDGARGELGALLCIRSHFSQIGENAALFINTDVAELTECHISDVGTGTTFLGFGGFSEMLVAGSIFHNINGIPGQEDSGDAIRADGLASLYILDCQIDSCHKVGIHLGMPFDAVATIDAVNIQGNHIHWTKSHGISGYENVSNAVIQNNEISHPGYADDDEDPEYCIEWFGHNPRIEENILHNANDGGCGLPACAGSGIHVATAGAIARNTIHHCAGNGVVLSSNPDNLQPAKGQLVVFNNVIHDIKGAGIAYAGSSQTAEPEQTLVRNNTVHVNGLSAPAPLGSMVVADNNNPVRIEGNIFIVEGQVDTLVYVLASGNGDVVDQRNLKVPGDIGFANFAGRDFHLATDDSPAYNFLPAEFGQPADDIDGELRLGLHDAGADERSTAADICGCTNCPSEIPDLSTGDFSFSVVSAEINDLASDMQGVCGVRVGFAHQYIGDLTMQLISPAGQSVTLIGPGGLFGSTEGTTWNVGFAPCSALATPDPGFLPNWHNSQPWGEGGAYTGLYYPVSGCLESFDQGTVTGDWLLRVTDGQASDIGNVLSFEVEFCNNLNVSCFNCSTAPNALFNANTVGAWGVAIVNLTTGLPTTYQIDFGDGSSFTGNNTPGFHEYSEAGAYLVRLIAKNDCGIDTFTQTVNIAGEPPVAFVFPSVSTGCAPLSVQMNVIDASHVDTWHWFFPGAVPSESFDKSPVVTYNAAGTFDISLIIENEVGSTTIDNIASITVLPNLEAQPTMSITVVGDSIVCNNTTPSADQFFWTLNDGPPAGSNISPVVFEVDSSGMYTIGLTVFNPCETATIKSTVTVIKSGTNELESQGWRFSLSPNPNNGQFQLDVLAAAPEAVQFSIIDARGAIIYEENTRVETGKNQYPFQLDQLPAGMYQLRVQTAKGSADLRFVVGK